MKKPLYEAVIFRAKTPYKETPIHFEGISDKKLLCRSYIPLAKQRRQIYTRKGNKMKKICQECHRIILLRARTVPRPQE